LIEEEDAEGAEVFTEVSNLETLNQTLKEKGLPVREAELRWIAKNTLEVTDSDLARSLLKLMDALEDLDDVQNVTANFEMADELMSLSMV
jgi:transcriptional/translational regulatory protein YebC/TACO1